MGLTAKGAVGAIQNHLVPIFESHSKVIAVFNGHCHYYQRLLKANIDYVITGGGGVNGGHDPWWNWDPGNPANPHRHCADRELNLFHYCTVDVPEGSGNPVVKKWKYRENQPPELAETVIVGEPPQGW